MAEFKVVLVSPMHDGNVGAVARAMANFGLSELCMIDPCEITEEGWKRAKHAGGILEASSRAGDLREAAADCDLVAGTSGKVTAGPKHFLRIPTTPRDFASTMKDYDGRVALVFGPEDMGLTQEQLAMCDALVHIPSHDGYPVLNLSHAVSIVLYELFQTSGGAKRPTLASEEDRERMFLFFRSLLEAIDYPEHRRDKTEVMFRRMMGRAAPTRWEYHTIMGVIGDAAKMIDGRKRLRRS